MHVYFLGDQDAARGWGEVPTGSGTVLNSLPQLKRLARDLFSPELGVVCLFGYRGWIRIVAALVTRLRGAGLVLRSDSNILDEQDRPRWRRLAKRLYLHLLLGNPEIWTIGTTNARYWSALGFHRQVRIPYVVPTVPARSADEATLLDAHTRKDFVVGFVGRLVESKGVEDLLQAWAEFRQRVEPSEVALLVCGAGVLESKVLGYAATEPTCRPLGALSHLELGSVYAHCDAVVVPSRSEPWGLVVNEALSYGTRVIASDRVGAADDLITAENGRRFPAGDVASLLRCLQDEHRRDRSRVAPLPVVDVASLMHARLRAHG